MQYLKRNTKYGILAFLVIVLSMTISISTPAKTKVYFSLYDNPQKEITKLSINPKPLIIYPYIFFDNEISRKIIAIQFTILYTILNILNF